MDTGSLSRRSPESDKQLALLRVSLQLCYAVSYGAAHAVPVALHTLERRDAWAAGGLERKRYGLRRIEWVGGTSSSRLFVYRIRAFVILCAPLKRLCSLVDEYPPRDI